MRPHAVLTFTAAGALCACAALLPISAKGQSPADSPIPAAPSPALATEAPAVLSATRFLPPAMVAGPNHRVRELVPTDGYQAYFTVDSDFGVFEVAGTVQLADCIREIDAIAKLNAVSRSDLFAEGLKRSIEQPVDAAKNVITHPVDTVKALPSTAGHFLKKIGNSVSGAANGIKSKIENRDSQDSNSAAGTARDVGKTIGAAGKGIIGFESAKLQCAAQLGVDPYTDNPRLRQEIDKVAWVYFAGGLPLRIGTMATGAGLAVGATKFAGLPEEVYSLTPGELALRDNQAMAAIGVPAPSGNAFNSNPALSPTLRHSILVSLASLNAAAGRAEAVTLASECTTRHQARFLSQALGILAGRQAAGAVKISEIKIFGRLPAGVDSSGKLILPMPSDYVSWTPETAAFVSREDLSDQRPEVWFTGALSPLTLENITKAGWRVQGL